MSKPKSKYASYCSICGLAITTSPCEEMTGCIEISGLALYLIGIIIGVISVWVMWDNRNTFVLSIQEHLALVGIVIGCCGAAGLCGLYIVPLLPCVVLV